MDINLTEKPKGATIIQGFPGFGMVGSVATEYLLDYLSVRPIGTINVKEIPPMVAIHKGILIPPIGVYYNEKYHLVILNFLTKGDNSEWQFTDIIKEIATQIEAKEIISLEGVAGQIDEQKVFAFSNTAEKITQLKEKGFDILEDSVIMGVSAALMLKKVEITAFFALTLSTLPDSNAAAELIKSLDKYLNLEIDYNPLYEQAKMFESKIKEIMSKSKVASFEKEKSMLNYLG